VSRAERIVVIGADAAGMSAAHQALRSARAAHQHVDVIVLERTQDTPYSACGIPYLLGGLVGSEEEFSARTPAKHRAMGVDLRMGTTAIAVDMSTRTVTAQGLQGRTHQVSFDKLVLATGAEPVIPG